MSILSDLRKMTHEQVCKLRNFERLISSDEFEEMFSGLTGDELRYIKMAIETKSFSQVKGFVKSKRLAIVEFMGIRALRERAQQIGVAKYSQLSKAELLAAVRHKEKLLHEQE